MSQKRSNKRLSAALLAVFLVGSTASSLDAWWNPFNWLTRMASETPISRAQRKIESLTTTIQNEETLSVATWNQAKETLNGVIQQHFGDGNNQITPLADLEEEEEEEAPAAGDADDDDNPLTTLRRAVLGLRQVLETKRQNLQALQRDAQTTREQLVQARQQLAELKRLKQKVDEANVAQLFYQTKRDILNLEQEITEIIGLLEREAQRLEEQEAAQPEAPDQEEEQQPITATRLRTEVENLRTQLEGLKRNAVIFQKTGRTAHLRCWQRHPWLMNMLYTVAVGAAGYCAYKGATKLANRYGHATVAGAANKLWQLGREKVETALQWFINENLTKQAVAAAATETVAESVTQESTETLWNKLAWDKIAFVATPTIPFLLRNFVIGVPKVTFEQAQQNKENLAINEEETAVRQSLIAAKKMVVPLWVQSFPQEEEEEEEEEEDE